MTCICTLKTNNTIYMAADRRLSDDDKYITLPEPKIAFKHDLLIGAAGDSYLCNIVLESFSWPYRGDETPNHYMFNVFRPKFIKFLKDLGHIDKESTILNSKSEDEVRLLAAFDEFIYQVDISAEAFSIEQVTNKYCAIGSGSDFALGALLATEGLNLKPQGRLKRAINAAASFSVSCDDNIDILRLE